MRLLKQLLPVAVVAFVGGQLVAGVRDNALLTLVVGLVTAVLAVLVYARMVRWSERRAPVEVALKGAAARLGVGALIGVAWFGAVIGNFAEAAIFSTEVSGNGNNDGLLHSTMSGPAMITGGEFGPEAAPSAIFFGIVLTVVFVWIAHRRGNLVPRRRNTRPAATATLAQ